MTKILIAEDDQFLRKVYWTKFVGLGFEVAFASDGEEVDIILKNFIPDIILLDIIMPKKDGFEVLAELKASHKFKNIPVLVASNLSQPEDQEKALSLGAVEYIIKSNIPVREIVERVQHHLSK